MTARDFEAPDFDALMEEAATHRFEGWDFSFLGERAGLEAPAWDYRERVLRLFRAAGTVMDIGTGGGEFLSSLSPLPHLTVATDGWRSERRRGCSDVSRSSCRTDSRPFGWRTSSS